MTGVWSIASGPPDFGWTTDRSGPMTYWKYGLFGLSKAQFLHKISTEDLQGRHSSQPISRFRMRLLHLISNQIDVLLLYYTSMLFWSNCVSCLEGPHVSRRRGHFSSTINTMEKSLRLQTVPELRLLSSVFMANIMGPGQMFLPDPHPRYNTNTRYKASPSQAYRTSPAVCCLLFAVCCSLFVSIGATAAT